MIYRFADCELDTTTFELRCGGAARDVQPQVLELLRYLIENRDRMVTKDELFDEVWSGRIVSESALSSRIKAARQAIGDDGGTQRLIRTVHGRGFRFVAEIENSGTADDNISAAPASRTDVDVCPGDRPSVAVLPFVNMSGDPEQEYFSDGITEDIITALSKYRWFFVTARNSSFSYKIKDVTVRQIAAELGVRYVLEGSVRRADSRVRITCQLIDARNGTHIWGEHYDGDLTDIFALQDEITSSIVSALGPELTSAEQARARTSRPENLAAWDYHLRGMWHTWRYTRADGQKAVENFERAIAVDPELSSAYAGLSLVLSLQVLMGWITETSAALQRARQTAETALRLDPKDAFPHIVMGRIFTLYGEHENALTELYMARDLNPNFALTHFGLAFTLTWFGRAEEALEHVERAIRQSPNDPVRWSFEMIKGTALWWSGRLNDAVPILAQARRHANADFWPSASAAVTLVDLGDQRAAQDAIAEAVRKRPELTVAAVDQMMAAASSELRLRYLENLRRVGLQER